MSDDVEQFYSAWIATFDGKPRKLSCNWHVDRVWRRSISNFIKTEEDQVSIYHTLRVLMEEMEEQKFYSLLESFLSSIQSDKAFEKCSDYFDAKYGRRYEQWAFCYRKRAGINTNMYAESFHRVLKHVYMKGKINKRLDSIIHYFVVEICKRQSI